MGDSRPRDLTTEEIAALAPAGRGGVETAPLRIPPGTEVAVELLNPAAETSVSAAPSAGPNEAITAAKPSGRKRN